MRLQSKRAIVAVGSVRSDQLAQSRTERSRSTQDLLSETRQMLGGLLAEREEMPDLRVLPSTSRHHLDEIAVRTGLRAVFDIRQKHGIHGRWQFLVVRTRSSAILCSDSSSDSAVPD